MKSITVTFILTGGRTASCALASAVNCRTVSGYHDIEMKYAIGHSKCIWEAIENGKNLVFCGPYLSECIKRLAYIIHKMSAQANTKIKYKIALLDSGEKDFLESLRKMKLVHQAHDAAIESRRRAMVEFANYTPPVSDSGRLTVNLKKLIRDIKSSSDFGDMVDGVISLMEIGKWLGITEREELCMFVLRLMSYDVSINQGAAYDCFGGELLIYNAILNSRINLPI